MVSFMGNMPDAPNVDSLVIDVVSFRRHRRRPCSLRSAQEHPIGQGCTDTTVNLINRAAGSTRPKRSKLATNQALWRAAEGELSRGLPDPRDLLIGPRRCHASRRTIYPSLCCATCPTVTPPNMSTPRWPPGFENYPPRWPARSPNEPRDARLAYSSRASRSVARCDDRMNPPHRSSSDSVRRVSVSTFSDGLDASAMSGPDS
jgi:hypothetical protein